MGCDIHAHIEHIRYPDRAPGEIGSSWWSFAGLVGASRNYRVFSAFTNGEVRGYTEAAPETVAPRGFPPDADWGAADEYYEQDNRQVEPATAQTEAAKWRAKLGDGAKVTITHGETVTWGFGEPHDGRHSHTTLSARWPGADWHTPSWLTTAEVARALESIGEPVEGYWRSVLDTMRALEHNGTPARLVFWFDN